MPGSTNWLEYDRHLARLCSSRPVHAHTSISASRDDCEKRNACLAYGWRA